MANMLLKEDTFSNFTKASCHCGRKSCSTLRKDARRTARRSKGAQAVKNDLRSYVR